MSSQALRLDCFLSAHYDLSLDMDEPQSTPNTNSKAMVIAAERTRDPKQPKRFEKNKNIDSRGVSQLQDSGQMANRCHGPLPILSWRRNNQPAFIRSKEDETNYHNWSNTFLFDQASPRDARRYAALVVGSWSQLLHHPAIAPAQKSLRPSASNRE